MKKFFKKLKKLDKQLKSGRIDKVINLVLG